MLNKVYRKYSKLFAIGGIAILLIGMIVVASGFVQSSELSELAPIDLSDGMDSISDSVAQTTSNSLTTIQNELEVQIQEKLAQEAEEEVVEEWQPPVTRYKAKALYDTYVHEIVSERYPNLREEYVRAVIYHESRYNPNEWGKKTNVQGLMQIMPKYHMDRARSLGVTDLFDPYGNILVGCDILSEMTNNYGFEYALNYHAGGYKYANSYKGSTSPYIKILNSYIELEQSGREMDIYGG